MNGKKYTLEEKVAYNKRKNTDFSDGYVFGVMLYNDYPKAGPDYRKTIKFLVDYYAEDARTGNESSKGIMCGIRDAANERKKKR